MSSNAGPAGGQQGQPSPLDVLERQGPPYPPQGAALGGTPTTHVDVPISAVFVLIFVLSAALNMAIFRLNLRRGHKFVLSAVFFGFSMARITANVMRIVWACRPHNTRVAIAAGILTNAGVLLLFIANLIFAQRLLRAYQPRLGWSQPLRLAFRGLFACIVACLVMVIISGVYSFYTLDAPTLLKLHDILLFAITFLAVLAFLPLPITALALLLPRREPVDAFGTGSMRTKVLLLLFTAVLLTFGAGFRAGAAYTVRPIADPAWFQHKAAYYCVNFTIEIIVVFTYALTRFDRRFHIPDGSCRPGDYSRGGPEAEKPVVADDEQPPTVVEAQPHETAWESRPQSDREKQDAV
ncbi:hypothetical protein TOPH_02309 [Tolypocladium ophioglossoides CBS 100239]|uniref:Family c-likeg-protein-coupled receptor protein n=1 Tax=Tolypocladium ophioglossoides (strain CBS 100239) TaxID=1163406 RepID=A0A0L0NGI0_TOLOC|nr:hypothetical protein TOPH_02309 [Tolypocladium ophioglossoides CBS 100239]